MVLTSESIVRVSDDVLEVEVEVVGIKLGSPG